MNQVSFPQAISKDIMPLQIIERRIFVIRGMKVMIDADLAELYGVNTKRLNEQVKRNTSRFPSDFMFQLNENEYKNLRSQFATSSSETELLNWSQFATGSQKHRDPKNLPYAFTEHGVAMLSSVLRSERAVQVNIFIIRAFIKIREILASNKELAYKIEELERGQRTQNRHINAIYSILDKFVTEPAKPKNPLGFRRD